MIDFRYHIVSLIAVFLALGVGVIVGATVLDAGRVRVQEATLERLRDDLRDARSDIDALRADRTRGDALSDQVAEWLVPARLSGRPFVTVFDGPAGRWRDAVTERLAQAGAVYAGSITFTERFKLGDAASVGDLTAITGAPAPPPGGASPTPSAQASSLADSVLQQAGRTLLVPEGRALLSRLAEGGFVEVSGADLRTPWPPRAAVLVCFATETPADSPRAVWLASFARTAAAASPTIVVASSPENPGAVGVLRSGPDAPPGLSTFDDGEAAYAPMAVVLVTSAAAENRGGHFGSERGRRLVPPPS